MKKITVDNMLEMDSCMDIAMDCVSLCPFYLEKKDWNKKYYHWCKAVIYCEENDINYDHNDVVASKIYIQHLKEQNKNNSWDYCPHCGNKLK